MGMSNGGHVVCVRVSFGSTVRRPRKDKNEDDGCKTKKMAPCIYMGVVPIAWPSKSNFHRPVSNDMRFALPYANNVFGRDRLMPLRVAYVVFVFVFV